MAWEENSRICLHMQLIAILSRTGVLIIKHLQACLKKVTKSGACYFMRLFLRHPMLQEQSLIIKHLQACLKKVTKSGGVYRFQVVHIFRKFRYQQQYAE